MGSLARARATPPRRRCRPQAGGGQRLLEGVQGCLEAFCGPSEGVGEGVERREHPGGVKGSSDLGGVADGGRDGFCLRVRAGGQKEGGGVDGQDVGEAVQVSEGQFGVVGAGLDGGHHVGADLDVRGDGPGGEAELGPTAADESGVEHQASRWTLMPHRLA